MIRKDDYIEFDLKSLFFYILRQWKAVVIFTLVIALVLGGFMTYSAYKDSKSTASVNSAEDLQQYQELLQIYEGDIATIQDRISTTQEYMDQSILMNIDYRNVYIATAIYNVDVGYQILPGNTYQDPDNTYMVTWYHRQLLSEYSLYEEASAQFGIEVKYLMELVQIIGLKDYSFSIKVYHPTRETAMEIMAFFQDQVIENHLHLNETMQEHTVTQMTSTCGLYVDEDLNTAQRAVYTELLTLDRDLTTLRNNKEKCETLIGSLQTTVNIGPSALVKTFIKWVILGCVIGVVLMAVILFLISLVRNRLHSTAQLVSCYQANVLGETVRSKASLPRALRRIHRLEGCLEEDSESNTMFLAENIRNHCGDAKNILICSDADSALPAALAEELNKHLSGIRMIPVGDLLKEADALRALSECDAVVMVAKRDVSRNVLIKKMLHLIESYKKESIGFIVSY